MLYGESDAARIRTELRRKPAGTGNTTYKDASFHVRVNMHECFFLSPSCFVSSLFPRNRGRDHSHYAAECITSTCCELGASHCFSYHIITIISGQWLVRRDTAATVFQEHSIPMRPLVGIEDPYFDDPKLSPRSENGALLSTYNLQVLAAIVHWF